MATPDDAKLDELKRLLRRLDKALPPSHVAPQLLQSSALHSTPPPGRASRQAAHGTALRTIVLAAGVSMIVSLSVVALLLHGTAPLQHILTALAPSTIGDRIPLLRREEPPQPERQHAAPAPVTETAALGPVDETPAGPPHDTAPTHAASAPSAATEQQIAAPSPPETEPVVDAPSPATPEVETSPEPVPAGPADAADDTPSPEAPPPSYALAELDASQFLQRGLNMLSSGNIEAAQLLLERAADLGNGDAAFALASTYDGSPGAPRSGLAVRPNSRLALRWYERAQALGIEAAQKRLGELKAAPGAQVGKVE